MADDFSLDPLATENDILNDQVRRAQALRLRAAPAIGDVYGRQERVYNDVMGQNIARQAESKRRDLSNDYETQLSAALQDAPPEIKALVLSPATRKEGLALLQKHHQMRQSDQEMRKYMPGGEFGGSKSMGGGAVGEGSPNFGGISMETANRMLQSDSKDVRERAKDILKQYEGHDPKLGMRYDPRTGSYVPIPGAAEGYAATQGAQYAAQHPGGYQVPNGQGGMTTLPAPGPQQAFPNANPTPSGPVVPPASGPSSPATGRSALPLSTGAAPVGDTQNMQPVPGGMQVDPRIQAQRDQIKIATLTEELRQEMPKAQAGDPTAQRNVVALQKEIAIAQKQAPPQQALPNANPQAPAPAPAPQGPPQGAPPPTGVPAGAMPPQGVPQPNAGPGNTNPIRQDVYKHLSTTQIDTLKKMEEGTTNGGKILNSLSSIERLNQNPTYSGGFGPAATAVDTFAGSFFGGSSDRAQNTQTLDAAIQNTLGPMLKEYGYNPSNRDLKVAAARLPQIGQDPKARQEIIDVVRKGVQAEIDVNNVVYSTINEALSRGEVLNPSQVQQWAWQQYNAKRDAEEAAKRQGNPTQAGGAKPALPATMDATDKMLRQPASGGLPGFAQDVVRNAKSLPGALFSQSGGEAMKDAYGNLATGARQLMPFVSVDRQADMAEQQRQEARAKADPDYNQARIFHTAANPATVGAAAAPTFTGQVVGAGLVNALRPEETWGRQAVNAVTGAVVAAPFAGASKAVPATRIHPSLNMGGEGEALLKQFPSFKPTSAQLNPASVESSLARGAGVNEAASLAQTKAITQDILLKAGVKGEQITPKNLATNFEEIGAAYNKMLPKNVSAKIASTDSQALKDAISRAPAIQGRMDGAPTLAGVLKAVDTGNPVSISARTLHDAWKEVADANLGKQASAEVRTILEGLIAKTLPQGNIAPFKALNQRFGLTKDIERVWRGGGSEGVAEASGYLNPAKIVTEAGSGPTTSMMDDAARLVNKFNVRNWRQPDATGSDSVGVLKNIAANTVGKVGAAIDRTAVRADEFTKHTLDWLRHGIKAAPSGLSARPPEMREAPPPENYNAP